MLHDCYGVILKSGAGVFTFVSVSGKVYATLDRNGLKVIKGTGKRKTENVIPTKALKTLIQTLERDERAKKG